MGRNQIDKASALYLMVEMVSHMTAAEIFGYLMDIGRTVAGRYDIENEVELKKRYPCLEACFQKCLKKRGA